MTPAEARWLLPSLVSGDLRGEERTTVQTALGADAALRSDHDKVVALRAVARLALQRRAPAMARRRSRPAWELLAGVVAAAVLLVAVPRMWPPPEELALVDLASSVSESSPGFVATHDPGALMHAFQAAGIGPYLSMVGDLSALGMQLEGGMVAPGPKAGTIVFYRKDGILWQCHMYEELERGGTPVAERVVEGVRLRAFQKGEMSWVVWEDGGLVCVLAAQTTPDAVLAAVAAKVEHAARG
jgi:hypothetical protein